MLADSVRLSLFSRWSEKRECVEFVQHSLLELLASCSALTLARSPQRLEETLSRIVVVSVSLVACGR